MKRVERIDSPIGVSLNQLSPTHMFTESNTEYNEHPTSEQLMVREAIRHLTFKQQKLWELWNYDRLTQDEIADKLHIDQSSVSRRIKTIEKRIAKWVRNNIGAYNLLKSQVEEKAYEDVCQYQRTKRNINSHPGEGI
jgi:DNA-directed RNA polymerase specialized sigma24 family protein